MQQTHYFDKTPYGQSTNVPKNIFYMDNSRASATNCMSATGGHLEEDAIQIASVCTCDHCPSSGIEEQYKKCCHEVAGWQENYNFTG